MFLIHQIIYVTIVMIVIKNVSTIKREFTRGFLMIGKFIDAAALVIYTDFFVHAHFLLDEVTLKYADVHSESNNR